MAERHRRNKEEESRKKTKPTYSPFPTKVSLFNGKDNSSSKKNLPSTKRSVSKESDKKHKLSGHESNKEDGRGMKSNTRVPTSKSAEKAINEEASSTEVPLPGISQEKSHKPSNSKEEKSKEGSLPLSIPVQEYEDDFEDYESDFEEDVEDEAKKVKEGANSLSEIPIEDEKIAESMLLQRLATAHANRSGPIESMQDQLTRQITFPTNSQTTTPQRSMSAQRKFSFVKSPANTYDADGDFSLNREETGNASSQQNREDVGQKQLVKLRSSPFYEYFQQLSGANAQLVQVGTQTGEDNVPMGCQTDLPETTNAVTQHPSHFVTSFSMASQLDKAEKNQSEEDTNVLPSIPSNSMQSEGHLQRLSKFVGIAGELIVNLIIAERPQEPYQLNMQHNSNIMLSSRYTTFSVKTIIKECKTSCITRDPNKMHNILYAIYIPSCPNPLLNRKSLLMEFDMEQPVSPAR